MDQNLLIAILAAAGGGSITTLLAGLFARPKSTAETNKLVAEAGHIIDERWKNWADQLDARLKAERIEHDEDLAKLRTKVGELERHAVVEAGKLAQLTTRLSGEQDLVRRLRRDLDQQQYITRKVIVWSMDMKREIERLDGTVPDMPRSVADYFGGVDGALDDSWAESG